MSQTEIKKSENVEDFLGRHPYKADLHIPADKAQLVASVVSAARPVRAIGADYSLSHAGVAVLPESEGGIQSNKTKTVISTAQLNLHLSQPYSPAAALWKPEELRDKNCGYLLEGMAASRLSPENRRHFIYVEAGIQIRKLLAQLGANNLALATMGAGGRQSLAGATSTGTHGGDFDVPILGDWIRAIHLITPDGKELWITPSDPEFFSPDPECRAYQRLLEEKDTLLAEAREPIGRLPTGYHVVGAPKTTGLSGPRAKRMVALTQQLHKVPESVKDRMRADDDLFAAACTSVGRLGVVYAVVLEVVNSYHLIEINLKDSWENLRKELKKSLTPHTGIFDRKLDLPKFNTQINEARNFVRTPEKIFEAAECGRIDGKPDVSPDQELPLRHLNLVVNLANTKECWITRRWAARSQAKVAVLQLESAELPKLLALALDNQKNPLGMFKVTGKFANAILDDIHLTGIKSIYEGPIKGRLHPVLCDLVNLILAKGTGPIDLNAIIDASDDSDTDESLADVEGANIKSALSPYKELVEGMLKLIRKNIPRNIPQGTARIGEFALLLLHKILKDPETASTVPTFRKGIDHLLKTLRDELVIEERKADGYLPDRPERLASVKNYAKIKKQLTYLEGFSKNLSAGGLLDFVTSALFDIEFPHPIRVDRATAILDTHNYKLDGLTSANSAEYFFNATDDSYIKFIEDIVDRAGKQDRPVFGYIGIRFMPKSRSLLAMQRYEATVSVEVATLRTSPVESFADFLKAVHESACKYNGIPHWGQEFQHAQPEKYLLQIYRDDLEKKWSAARRSVDPNGKFETDFSKRMGLG